MIALTLAVITPAGAATKQRVQPVGLPLSLVLPDDWSGHSFAAGPLAYQAFGPNLSTEFDVQRETPAPSPQLFEQEFTKKKDLRGDRDGHHAVAAPLLGVKGAARARRSRTALAL